MKIHNYDDPPQTHPPIIHGPYSEGAPTAMEEAWQSVNRKRRNRNAAMLSYAWFFAAGFALAAWLFYR